MMDWVLFFKSLNSSLRNKELRRSEQSQSEKGITTQHMSNRNKYLCAPKTLSKNTHSSIPALRVGIKHSRARIA